MQCVIDQPAGLGDIIFCQKIVDFFIDHGYTVIWPVVDEYYETVNHHMRKDNLVFCHVDDDYPLKACSRDGLISPVQLPNKDLYLPLRYADLSFPRQSVMKAKYKILYLDHNNWQNHFLFERNTENESLLYYDVLGLKDNSSYVIVNEKYGSPPHYKEKNIELNDKYQIVEMDFYSDFTLFDWCKVIECAQEIHSVETSLFYIIEKLTLKTPVLEAYSKHTPTCYMHVEGLFATPWHYN